MLKRRYSVPNWCFFKEGMKPQEYYATLAELGIAAVEMAPSEHRPIARSNGLQVLNVSGPGMEKGLNRKANHPELLAGIRECIRQAQQMHVQHVIVFSGNRAGQPDSEGIANCTEALRTLAPEAESAGVTLVLEMLNGYDHPDYQAEHSAFGFAVVRETGSPAVKVLYDIYHMHRMDEDIEKTLIPNLDLVAHLHIAGSPGRDLPRASGQPDYAALVPRIEEAGYAGNWGFEFVPKDEPLTEVLQAVELFESF